MTPLGMKTVCTIDMLQKIYFMDVKNAHKRKRERIGEWTSNQ